jgi:adenosylcobinamide-phosphate guanylyltransferase
MLALILAGGSGTRLDLGEKPLVTIRGKPMIEYVIEAFSGEDYEMVVILSDKSPFTRNWCRARGIEHLVASGSGYIADIADAVSILEEEGPLFTCVADLPCISPGIIREIETRYRESGKEACSVWVPLDLAGRSGCRSLYSGTIEGVAACPAGINIMRGDLMGRPQDEIQLLCRDERLAYNINTRNELESVRSWFGDRKNQRS